VQPSRTATVCEVDRARKRAASRKRAQTSDTGQPLETDHPETTHLTAPCSCEACSAFTRVAARTLAPSPICDALHRRLQPFRHLHDCSGCFRLERSPGGTLTHWKASRRTRYADMRPAMPRAPHATADVKFVFRAFALMQLPALPGCGQSPDGSVRRATTRRATDCPGAPSASGRWARHWR
jgi:hypothetical protein